MKIKFGLIVFLAILLTSGLAAAQDATATPIARTTELPCSGHYLSFEMGDTISAGGLQTETYFFSGSKSLVFGFDDLTGMVAIQDDAFSFTVYFGSADVENKAFVLENKMEVPAGAMATFPLDQTNHPYIIVMMDCQGPSDITVTTTKDSANNDVDTFTFNTSLDCVTSRQFKINGVIFPKIYTFENDVITWTIFPMGGTVDLGVVYQGPSSKNLTVPTIWGHWFSDTSTGIAQGILADGQSPDTGEGSPVYGRHIDALNNDVLSVVVTCN